MAEPEKEIKSTPEGQVRAVMAACVAMEVRAGRTPAEAKRSFHANAPASHQHQDDVKHKRRLPPG